MTGGSLCGQVQAPERHAKQELNAGHDAVAIADARPALHQVQLEAADVIGAGGVRRALQERGEPPAAVDVASLRRGPSWRAFMSSVMLWRNGLIERVVMADASLVEVVTSIFRKAFPASLRGSHQPPCLVGPSRDPHQPIAKRFSAMAISGSPGPLPPTTGTWQQPDVGVDPVASTLKSRILLRRSGLIHHHCLR
jgi:hypothetical protein